MASSRSHPTPIASMDASSGRIAGSMSNSLRSCEMPQVARSRASSRLAVGEDRCSAIGRAS